MLLRFAVSNYGSIYERQELSMVASSLRDNTDSLISWPSTSNQSVHSSLLPVAVILGPNASGKSQFVDAIMFLRSLVLYSQSRGDFETTIPRNPFRLAPGSSKEPSVFVIEFLVKGVHHEYGCALLDKRVDAEWLYRFPSRRKQMLFERNDSDFRFGRSLRGPNKRIADLIRPNSLFLSAAGQNNHEELKPVLRFFTAMAGVRSLSPPPSLVTTTLHALDKVDERILHFLKQIDTGIIDYQQKTRTKSKEELDFERRLLAVAASHFNIDPAAQSRLEEDEDIYIELVHAGKDNYHAVFDIDEESAGTTRLLFILPRLFEALDTGAAFILDELDVSIHTFVCELILDLFSSPDTNPNRAQLITTTHNTELLQSETLRRDQFWLADKDPEGATHLFSLAEYRLRKDDNRKRGYLEGRFGAIPYARRVKDLGPIEIYDNHYEQIQ